MLLGNAIMEEVEAARIARKGGEPSLTLHYTLAGRIVHKYRMVTPVSKATWLSRTSLLNRCGKKMHRDNDKAFAIGRSGREVKNCGNARMEPVRKNGKRWTV